MIAAFLKCHPSPAFAQQLEGGGAGRRAVVFEQNAFRESFNRIGCNDVGRSDFIQFGAGAAGGGVPVVEIGRGWCGGGMVRWKCDMLLLSKIRHRSRSDAL